MGKRTGSSPPETVYVEPYTYEVVQDANWSAQTGNMGNCMNDMQRIIIDSSLTPQSERDTVLHELLHAIWGQTSLQKRDTEDQQEEAIWQLTPRILALLKDNPRLVEYLLGDGAWG